MRITKLAFFNLESGQLQSEMNNLCCWTNKEDEYIWFSVGGAQLSVLMSDQQLQMFCDFLAKAGSVYTDYTEDRVGHDLFVALEDAEENRRNLCIYDKWVQMVLNLKADCLTELADCLRSQRGL